MLALKRVILVIFVLAAPAGLSGALYFATMALLAATNRVIDPAIVRAAAAIEFALFLWIAALEAKSRWPA